MPSVREHLIFKALAALQEVREASVARPIEPTWPIRFCLAYLYSQSGGDRSPYDYFWREMGNVHPVSTDGGSYMRHMELGRALSSIMARLGFHDTARTAACLRKAHSAGAVDAFWAEVQKQLDDGRPMPTPRFKRG
ncbi:hypothetical protein [Sphingomonas sp. SRS2]|uniref:hypothetical protein n=1 Tax=Sphingomonas sp. SRS2 TaxID=133190 RepID=UPI0006183FB7|nr:hypothetical protein [Sphingomonas sp. SRS2]KKC24439.1 hypothetical protein WP12_19300 [Sphingomonas sp. SRS2]